MQPSQVYQQYQPVALEQFMKNFVSSVLIKLDNYA